MRPVSTAISPASHFDCFDAPCPILTPDFRLPTSARRSRAFTLLELLAAISLVALIGLSLFATLRIATRARDSSEALLEPQRTADLAFEMIRQDLENAQPPSGVLSATFTGGDFRDGRGRDGDTVRFFTTSKGPQHESGDGDIRRVEYLCLASDGNDTQGEYMLVRRVIHNLLSPFEPPADDEVILRGIGGFDLQFWDGALGTWVPTWESAQQNNSVPMAIQVSIDLDRTQLVDGQSQVVTRRFVRVVQLPCAIPAQNTSGLGTGR
ncbi:type II secretion system protein GspJ [Humisphaera borealis]|uniref:Type II secretion system protein J n=1 Tax=Humisphaera borealis TaxID=2807512 RepID=A0A7M2WZA2_9BACT|nr:type II secretion system protein GspJ [Humisphaera borealis]QOV89820.1 prepilin-type N-terminal cleavage/methylation domain-containing protein [Humisphaera borealis]